MRVLGLQGSPRKKGNTHYLLSSFMDAAQRLGGVTQVVQVAEKHIEPCREYIVCEKKGFCPIDDDMGSEMYALLRRADVVVAATPVFFYNAPAQLKALIDRSQTLWARKYKLHLTDPGRKSRRGFLLAVGATKGKNLFEGLHLTAKYFFDAVGASFAGSLTYRHIENKGDMQKHPTVLADVSQAAEELLNPLLARKTILFAGRTGAGRSQMAAAFCQFLAGDTIEAVCSGSAPAKEIHPLMSEAMKEKGIDMAFRIPQSTRAAVSEQTPGEIVYMDENALSLNVPRSGRQIWRLPDPPDPTLEFFRRVRDEIERKVTNLIATI